MLQFSDYSRALYKDAFVRDEVEMLPADCLISNGDIFKYSKYEDFEFINSDNETVQITDVKELLNGFFYYYDIFDTWKVFNTLPHGKGTLDELPWVIDMLKFFNTINSYIEVYNTKKR